LFPLGWGGFRRRGGFPGGGSLRALPNPGWGSHLFRYGFDFYQRHGSLASENIPDVLRTCWIFLTRTRFALDWIKVIREKVCANQLFNE
jgi:hypothetical protein